MLINIALMCKIGNLPKEKEPEAVLAERVDCVHDGAEECVDLGLGESHGAGDNAFEDIEQRVLCSGPDRKEEFRELGAVLKIYYVQGSRLVTGGRCDYAPAFVVELEHGRDGIEVLVLSHGCAKEARHTRPEQRLPHKCQYIHWPAFL